MDCRGLVRIGRIFEIVDDNALRSKVVDCLIAIARTSGLPSASIVAHCKSIMHETTTVTSPISSALSAIQCACFETHSPKLSFGIRCASGLLVHRIHRRFSSERCTRRHGTLRNYCLGSSHTSQAPARLRDSVGE